MNTAGFKQALIAELFITCYYINLTEIVVMYQKHCHMYMKMYLIVHVHVAIKFHSGILITLSYIDLVSICFLQVWRRMCSILAEEGIFFHLREVYDEFLHWVLRQESRWINLESETFWKKEWSETSSTITETTTGLFCFPLVIINFDVSVSRTFHRGITSTENSSQFN
jgi:hypothetical protein